VGFWRGGENEGRAGRADVFFRLGLRLRLGGKLGLGLGGGEGNEEEGENEEEENVGTSNVEH
jgi:hypothetical protein